MFFGPFLFPHFRASYLPNFQSVRVSQAEREHKADDGSAMIDWRLRDAEVIGDHAEQRHADPPVRCKACHETRGDSQALRIRCCAMTMVTEKVDMRSYPKDREPRREGTLRDENRASRGKTEASTGRGSVMTPPVGKRGPGKRPDRTAGEERGDEESRLKRIALQVVDE